MIAKARHRNISPWRRPEAPRRAAARFTSLRFGTATAAMIPTTTTTAATSDNEIPRCPAPII